MVKLYSSPARDGLIEVLRHAKSDLLIASPFIKAVEADWVCNELTRKAIHSSIHLQVLTDLRSENVLNGSLDIKALNIFSDCIDNTILINLPRLHAKVYLADANFALITSANLTPSGMETNFEYGVGFSEPNLIDIIRQHLQAYARLGNILDRTTLSELANVAGDVSKEFRKLQRQAVAPHLIVVTNTTAESSIW